MRSTFRNWIVSVCLASWGVIGVAHAQEAIPAPKSGPIESPIVSMVDSAPLSNWYVQAGVVILHRDVASAAVLVTSPTGKALTIGKDFSFNWSFGPQVLIGRMVNDDTAVEANYFGLYSMHATLTQPGPGIPVGGTGVRTNFFADYRSEMHSAEFNARRWANQDLSFSAGFRYINWQEDLSGGNTIPAVAAIPPRGVIAVIAGAPAVPAKAVRFDGSLNNNLYGGQIGAEWKRSCGQYGIDAYSKIGLYGNEAYGRGSFANGSGATSTSSASRCQTAFVGEIGVVGTYQVSNAFNLRAGYTMMWIDGLAIFPQQAQAFNGGNGTINTNGSVFLNGVVLGAELRW